jgi:hypothetical protein
MSFCLKEYKGESYLEPQGRGAGPTSHSGVMLPVQLLIF